MCAMGDVGVFGVGLDRVGDFGRCLVVILVGGGLTACAVFVVCRFVVGGGPDLLSSVGFIFLTIAPALVLSGSLETDLGALFCTFPDERASLRFFASTAFFGAFEGVPGSAKEETFDSLPIPSSPVVDDCALLGCGRVSFFESGSVFMVEVFSMFPPSVIAFSCMPPRLLTSLALLRPRIGGPPFSPGRSTATKLARTLLTGLLLLETSEALGERPRLGGEVD